MSITEKLLIASENSPKTQSSAGKTQKLPMFTFAKLKIPPLYPPKNHTLLQDRIDHTPHIGQSLCWENLWTALLPRTTTELMCKWKEKICISDPHVLKRKKGKSNYKWEKGILKEITPCLCYDWWALNPNQSVPPNNMFGTDVFFIYVLSGHNI